MADDPVFFKEVVGIEADFSLDGFVAVYDDGFGAFCAVTAGNIGGNGFAIGDDGVNDAAGDVVVDGTEMVAERIARGLAGLGHEIRNVYSGRFGADDRAGDFRNEEIGNDAGVERARSHQDEVGFVDRFDGRGKRTDPAGRQFNSANGSLAAGDAGFALHALAVRESCDQVHIGDRRGKDAAANGENLAGNTDGFGEVPGHVCQSGKKKIAEVVATEAAAGVETVLEQAAQKRFVFRERDHAVANVAGRKNAIFAAQAAGAAPVIGYGDDGGKVGDGPFRGGILIAAADNVVLQSAEERGKAGAATQGDNAETAESAPFRVWVFHQTLKLRACITRCGAAPRRKHLPGKGWRRVAHKVF